MTETPWLTLAEAVTYTKRSERTVRGAAVECDRSSGARGLRGYQQGAGCSWRFHTADLDRWVRGEAPARSSRLSVASSA
jgi:heme oxygenase